MTEHHSADERKRRVIAAFNTIAADYDTLRFVQRCAGRLIELAALTPGARVLDVATGTGLVALVAAQLVGPSGRVVGVDIAPEMLERARRKLAATDLGNVEFRSGDAERLDLPDGSFDVVLCASSLFFMPDMLAALREWHRVLAPGGRVGFSSFGPGFLLPLNDIWAARLREHGVSAPTPPTQRLADPAVCAQLLRDAGFADVEVRSEQLGYYLADGRTRWQELEASLDALTLTQLSPDQRAQIQAEHIAELDALATEQGLWADLPAHFTFGRRA